MALYLKKVEIQGFKSFADKTEIEFKNGITAIVGPNGSGKSNVSDAIRWVLGEQSVKNLRGSKMEDVIFSGTDNRRPLGYAEVTITFDNSSGKIPIDYAEVAVTRRMFRSGESEFYLNKSSCRLKDIRELFMDSGIGKDGYSIIGQGKIDEILSNRPEDRRNIFEEAAGIIKYRTRKEEAERKLEKTENNIIRIKDLIIEISNQKDVLEVEADKANTFTKLYSRLRDLEVNIYIRDIKKLDKQIKELKIEQESITKELIIIEDEKNRIEEKYNILKINIQKIEDEIEQSRSIRFDTLQNFEKNKNQIVVLTEKESFLKKDIERLNKEREELRKSINNLDNDKLDKESNLKSIDEDLKNLNIEFNNKNEELKHIENELNLGQTEIEELKNSAMNLYNLISDKKSVLNSNNSLKESIDNRITQLNKEIESLENNVNELVKKIEEKTMERSSLRNNLKIEEDNSNTLTKEKFNIDKKISLIDENIKSLQIKLNGLNASYNLYKNMEEGYEGYYKSVKGILQDTKNNKNLNKGLIGVVSNLLKVDTKYEKAIDISLGSSSQNIVVETEDDAKALVNYLKTNKLGRATFLPINVIKGKRIKLDSKDKDEFNILGLANELITHDKRYDDLFEYLLGRTIIVQDIDSGIKLANKQGHIHKIVTLDGEVLNSGGSITGGSFNKETPSIISRKNKIERLYKEINSLNDELKKFESDKDQTLEYLNDLIEKITANTNLIKEIEFKLNNTDNILNNNEEEVKRVQTEISKKGLEINTLLKELEGLNSNKNKLLVELTDIDKELENLKIDIEYKSKLLTNLKNSQVQMDKVVTNFIIEINNLENTKGNLLNNIFNYDSNKEQVIKNIENKDRQIEEINNNIKSCEDSKKLIEEEITKYENDENQISIGLNELIKKKENYMKTFYDEQDRLRVINKKISEIEKQNNNYDIKLARYELQYDNIINRLQEDYEINLIEAEKLEKEIDNIQAAQKEVKELRENIKSLGHVNISAIEDFKNISERFEFITKQHKDLVHAKEDLKEVIIDMERKMKDQFLCSFEEINKKFTEVFSILFNGGKARLELEEDVDILKAGIEIKVQPPGKKLQSLSLLSGGEKSMTAVALLFAMLNNKPAPFCILDEIDAALDEANITRYTSYLKNFTDVSQFVLITHRKSTMEIADILYGITMEEEGISKIVSLKLKDKLIQAS
jgi:chromosome segregation protein